MRHTGLLCILLILLPAAAFGQDFFPAKDLAFAQIAVGGGYETVLNVTNRGTSVYNGTLTLIPADRTKAFPTVINGTAPSGPLDLAINPGATASFRITSGDASLGTLSGFATITSADRNQPSMLEGNLTYYVKSSDGTIVDSAGVAPSNQVFQTVIPFDDFLTVALALVYQAPADQTAGLSITVFDDKNVQVGTTNQALRGGQQVAKFLWQYFPYARLTKGRVEIQSDRLFIGTALTFVKGSQASSLPFLPSMKVYNYSGSYPGNTITGKMYFCFNGPYMTGYVRIETINGAAVPLGIDQISGVLKNGNLEIYIHQGRGTSMENLGYLLITGYSPSQATQSGTAVGFFVNPPGVLGTGNVTFTAVN